MQDRKIEQSGSQATIQQALTPTLQTLMAELQALKQEVVQQKQEINTLKQQVTTLTKENSELTERFNELRNRLVLSEYIHKDCGATPQDKAYYAKEEQRERNEAYGRWMNSRGVCLNY